MPEPKAADWQKLVVQYRELAFWCIRPYLKGCRWQEVEEWESVALLALTMAGRAYDPDYRTKTGRSVKFNTYAVWYIQRKLWNTRRKLRRRRLRTCSLNENLDVGVLPPQPAPILPDLDGLIERSPLTERQRHALRRHYEDGLNYTELGQEMGVSRQCAISRVRRAIDILKITAGLHVEPVRKRKTVAR